LRDVQYGDGTKLAVRTALHQRFSTATAAFPDFEAALIEWPEAPDVLECGTGTGRFWENTRSPKSATLTLTDLSQGMVDAALVRASEHGFGDVTGQACDVQELPFADASFDVVVANHMLYHVPDPDQAVTELARVLRPGGALLAATNGYGHMDVIKELVAEVFEDHDDKLYEVFGIDTGEQRLRRSFASIVWQAYDNDLVIDDPTAVTAYGLSFPPGEFATATEASAFDAAVKKRFVDGTLCIHTRTGAFVCRNPRRWRQDQLTLASAASSGGSPKTRYSRRRWQGDEVAANR
jgi:SAM-dependent methyltransferase